LRLRHRQQRRERVLVGNLVRRSWVPQDRDAVLGQADVVQRREEVRVDLAAVLADPERDAAVGGGRQRKCDAE
jgi:hypothetical protein